MFAPRSSLNAQITEARSVEFVRLPFRDVRDVADAFDVTINDVLLAIVGGGLHDLFKSRGELSGKSEVQALVPVGLVNAEGRGLANDVSALFVRLPIGTDDPVTLLRAVSAKVGEDKRRHQALATITVLRLLEPLPQGVLAVAAEILQHQPFFNLVVTNVPGPPVPLYALGSKLLEAFPIVPLAGNQSMAVAALSYEGQLNLGVLSDPVTCPDVEVFCAGVVANFQSLVAQSKRTGLARGALGNGCLQDQGHDVQGPSSLHIRQRSDHTASMPTTPKAESHPGKAENMTPQSDSPGVGRAHPGDLARRVSHRRIELGITIEELAKRAGVDPTYLSYFERNSDARLSAGTLNLLALALDTSPLDLQGGQLDRPLGRGRAGRHPCLETLTREQCEVHLGAGGVGRIVFSMERGPVALPVNFEFTNGDVVVSTDLDKATLLESLPSVGFEIDRVDESVSEGWSVLVTGAARRVDDPDELVRLASLDLEAWAGGVRNALVCITPTEVTGRVIVHYSPPDED